MQVITISERKRPWILRRVEKAIWESFEGEKGRGDVII